MSSTLTVLIAKLQAQLLDNGTLFSTPTSTVAFREALRKFNIVAPIHAATLIDVVASQKEYALNDPTIGTLLDIEGVWLKDALYEEDKFLSSDFYFEDNAPLIRLREAQASGTLIVRYTTPHTVSGLDSSTDGILSADQEQVLTDGACYEAINVRRTSLVEGYNLSPNVIQQYENAAVSYLQAFNLGLARYAARRPAVGAPDDHAWNDEWHNWLRWMPMLNHASHRKISFNYGSDFSDRHLHRPERQRYFYVVCHPSPCSQSPFHLRSPLPV